MTPVFISTNMGMVRGWTRRGPVIRHGQQHLLVQCPLDLDDGERVTLIFSNPGDGTDMEASAEATPSGVAGAYWLRIVAWLLDEPPLPGLVRGHVAH